MKYECQFGNEHNTEGLKFADDRSDARWLAHMLRVGLLPEGYYAMAEQRTGQTNPDVLTLKAPDSEPVGEETEVHRGADCPCAVPARQRHNLFGMICEKRLPLFGRKLQSMTMAIKTGNDGERAIGMV